MKDTLRRITDWANFIVWIILIVLISLILKNESIGIEYKMIWLLLAFLGFTISGNQLGEK